MPQGSIVTRFGCGGISDDNFITTFLLSLIMQERWQPVSTRRSWRQEQCGIFVDAQCQVAHFHCHPLHWRVLQPVI